MNRKRYPSDTTDKEWDILDPHVPAPKSGGRPAKWSRREIMDAIYYVMREGGTWRALPHDYPPWQSVYYYFRLWRIDGTWERLNDALREELRVAIGRDATPSAAILDSQSVKSTQKGGLLAAHPVSDTTGGRR
jgi:putative transposase